MNRIAFFLAFPFVAGCNVGSCTQWVVAKTVGTTVEVGKGVIDGTKAGIAEGRSGLDVDGVQVLTTPEAIAEALDFELVGVGPGPGQVQLGIRNTTQQPVRIGRLAGKGETLAIDAEGFSKPLAGGPPGHLLGTAIDVPADAKIEVSLQFEDSGRPITSVRIAGEDVELR